MSLELHLPASEQESCVILHRAAEIEVAEIREAAESQRGDQKTDRGIETGAIEWLHNL
jgi:hypothetical protein